MSIGAWRGARVLPLAGVTAVIVLSWLYLLRGHTMPGGHIMPGMAETALEQWLAAFLLWAVMMVAMMLPTALPAIDLFGTLAARRVSVTGHAAPTSLFVLGYSAVWTGYSLVAAAGQVVLSRWGILAPASPGARAALSAALLVTAGAFQFSSLKQACLTQCRSPFPFLLAHWRDGDRGAFFLGARHGSYCLGCCWAMMGLMFISGSVNLLWMGVLSLFMLGEKLAPARWRVSQGAGVLLILSGIAVGVRLIH